jgi:alkylated DNA nucleotide flippase Atl1
MTDNKMDQILDTLDQARQRATYGAVAALLGTAPRTLMSGRERDHRHSWVVSRKSGQPTGYEPGQTHPELLRSERVIETREELEGWLATRVTQ